jgi:thioredoxin reductase (NADPH)
MEVHAMSEQSAVPGGETEVYDVIVIGGGPSGTTAALYAARAGLRTLVLDKGLTTGAAGLAGHIANYPGVSGTVAGADLVATMRRQAEEVGAEFVQEKVLMTILTPPEKEAHTGRGVYRGRTVVIATGAMGRTNTVPGEERLLGRGVSYCATCDGAFFRAQDVAVVGNHDEALEETLYLARLANRVVVLSQTTELQASPELIAQVEGAPNVEVRLGHRVREVLGEAEVEGLHVAPRVGEPYVLGVAAAFIYLQGNRPITDFLYGELPTTESGCLEVGEMMETAIPGVFAVGDVLCNHVKQVVIAAADGAKAAMGAERYLSGRERLRPDWS